MESVWILDQENYWTTKGIKESIYIRRRHSDFSADGARHHLTPILGHSMLHEHLLTPILGHSMLHEHLRRPLIKGK